MMPLHTSEEQITPMPATDARREQVLRALQHLGGSAHVADLCAITHLHPSTVRNALKRLEWAHVVERVGVMRSTKQARAVFRLVGQP